MSLKELIRALFKLSGGQAMPSANYIDLPLNSPHDTLKDYIAPCDGYLVVLTDDTNGWAECRNDNINFMYTRSNGDFPSAYMPVSKGQNVKYRLSQASSGYHYARFIKLIGGGAKSLLSQTLSWIRGGGLCLKTFSARLLNRCLRTRRATLRLSACRTVVLFIKHIHRQQAPLSSRLTGGYEFKHSATVYKPILTRALLSSITKISNGHLSYCPLKRDRTSCITPLLDSSAKLTFGLFTIKQTNNLATEVCHA